jgi:AcrR family transcriptional regulator
MNDIAAQAGVAVGTLYNHFKDREALLHGLLEVRHQEVLERLDAALDEPRLEFRARVEHVLGQFFGYFEAHRPFFTIMSEAELAQRPPGKAEVLKEIYGRMERLVKRGIKEKALRSSGAELFPALLMSSIRAVLIRQKVCNVQVAVPVDELVRYFFDGAANR